MGVTRIGHIMSVNADYGEHEPPTKYFDTAVITRLANYKRFHVDVAKSFVRAHLVAPDAPDACPVVLRNLRDDLYSPRDN